MNELPFAITKYTGSRVNGVLIDRIVLEDIESLRYKVSAFNQELLAFKLIIKASVFLQSGQVLHSDLEVNESGSVFINSVNSDEPCYLGDINDSSLGGDTFLCYTELEGLDVSKY